jgi:hypothetical protein
MRRWRRHDQRVDQRRQDTKPKVPFLPNFITTMSLFCGFYSSCSL